jgi:hypothetical protein
MHCIPRIRIDNFSFSMMTGVFIERLLRRQSLGDGGFRSNTTCPSTCLQQQFQQQQFQQL